MNINGRLASDEWSKPMVDDREEVVINPEDVGELDIDEIELEIEELGIPEQPNEDEIDDTHPAGSER